MSSINFDNPWLLLIAVPLVALFALPFALAIRKDNVNGHNIASGIIHIIMAILIAFSAAGTYIATTVTETDVYVLADVSYSANLNLDTVDDYIEDLGKNLPDNSRMGVVCFGRDRKIVTPLGEKFKTVKDSGVDDSLTDIVDALKYAGSLFRSDVIKRIVLITDGRATDGTEASDIQSQVNALAERNITVDAIYLNDNMSGDTEEVQMTSVEVTSSVTLGMDEQALISLQVNCTDGAKLTTSIKLYRNDELYKTASLTAENGTETISFDLYTDEEGVYDYRAEVECDNDFNANNNVISFTQTVSGGVSVLLISGHTRSTDSDKELIQELYEENGNASEVTAVYVGTDAVPYTVEDLCKYDQIILSDVDTYKVDHCEMFLSSLDTVVSVYGKSLLTFGNTGVQSYVNGELSALSDMLPVTYGKNLTAPKAYVILIDVSRSMGTFSRLIRAKQAAKEIVGLAQEGDAISIVAFYGNNKPVRTLTPITTDKTALNETIDSLTTIQGTVLEGGLQAAMDQLDGGNYGDKRVFLITDGLNHDGGDDEVLDIAKEMNAKSVGVTVMDVGRSGNSDSAANKAAEELMETIAYYGGGSVLDISTDEKLEEILADGLPQDVTGQKEDGSQSAIIVNRARDEVLDGVDVSGFGTGGSNYLRGYKMATAKSNAYTVLTAAYIYDEGDGTAESLKFIYPPLYSYWRYGEGRVASFTCNLTGSWISSVKSDVREALFTNILTTNIPEEKTDYPYLFETSSDVGKAEISVKPSSIREDGRATITVTAPDGTVSSGSMAFGTSAYEYTALTPSQGKYEITVTYSYGAAGTAAERSFTATKYVYVSYTAEYDSFALYDASSLIKGIGANGKVSTDGKLTIENDEKDVGKYFYYLTVPLLIACAVLYAADIAVRKLKWEDIRSLFKRSSGGRGGKTQ